MSRKLLKSSAWVSLLTLGSRILGYIRDALIFISFGSGWLTDAFFVASRIPNLLRTLSAEGAFSMAFIPALSAVREEQGREGEKDLINHWFGLFAVLLFIVTMIGVILAPVLVWVFAPGFVQGDGRFDLTVSLLRVIFPYILFVSLVAMATAILHSHQRFALPAISPLLLNVSMITSILYVAPLLEQPVFALAFGMFFAGLIQLGFQFFLLAKIGYLPKFRFNRHHEGVKKVFKLWLPAILASSVGQLNYLVITIAASFLVVGSVSWLYGAERFVQLPVALVILPIVSVILPRLADEYAQKREDDFSTTQDWAMRIIMLAVFPATIGLVSLAEPIIATTTHYGKFTEHDVIMMGLGLSVLALEIPALGLSFVLNRSLYSRAYAKGPLRASMLSFSANLILIPLMITLWRFMEWEGEHAALVLAVTMSAYLQMAYLFYLVKRLNIHRASSGWWWFLARIVLASAVMGYLLWRFVPENAWWLSAGMMERVTAMLLIVLAGALVYAFVLLLSGMRVRHIRRASCVPKPV